MSRKRRDRYSWRLAKAQMPLIWWALGLGVVLVGLDWIGLIDLGL